MDLELQEVAYSGMESVTLEALFLAGSTSLSSLARYAACGESLWSVITSYKSNNSQLLIWSLVPLPSRLSRHGTPAQPETPEDGCREAP